MRALQVLGVLLVVALCLAAGAAACAVVYFWWYGVLKSFMVWQSVPMVIMVPIGILMIGFAFTVRWFAGVLTIFGFFATILVLDWAWYWSMLLYVPTLAILTAGGIMTMIVAIVFGASALIKHLAHGASR